MGYGYFDEDTVGGGGTSAFDANKVTSSSGGGGYGTGGMSGGYDMGPVTGGYPTSGGSASSGGYGAPGAGGPGGNSGMTSQQGASAGAAGGPWGAIIGAAAGSLDSRLAALRNAPAARAAIPSPQYAMTLKDMLDKQAIEGKMLAQAKLGPRASAAASAVGQRNAEARGLSGPLAASVASESQNQAQGNFDQWRVGMLQNYRQSYLGLVQQYLAALESRRQAQVQSGYADREAMYAYLPLDSMVGRPIAQGLMNATGGPGNDASIQRMGAYNGAVGSF